MANPNITHFTVNGPDIQNIIWNHLLPAVQGVPEGHAIVSMITLTVLLMKPDATLEELQNAVQGATQTIVLALSEIEGEAN